MDTIPSAGRMIRERYQVTRVLHQSAWSSVYFTSDKRFPGKWWAIKELRLHTQDQAERLRIESLFQETAISLASCIHPNIVRVVDFFCEHDHLYLVMEYVRGSSLQVIYDTSLQPLPDLEVAGWGIQLAEALQFVYFQQGKPAFLWDIRLSHIMLDDRNQIKLVDFGLAGLLDRERIYHQEMAVGNRTRGIHSLSAKMGYAAPELFGEGGDTSAQCHVYAVGAMLHQLLSRRDPASSPFVFPPLGSLNPQVSPRLEKVIEKATRYNAEERHGTLLELKKDLIGFVSSSKGAPSDSSQAAPEKEPPSTTAAVVAGGVFLLLFLLVLAYFLFF
ncbi:MAG: serine/threonine protein kinase [Armatimonadetes bacterium]|nr:serine/threonine protein kinase [Armatimonadota bacterium]